MLQHLFMHSRIPDNALLPYFFFSGLELGLYQTGGYLTAVLQDACHRRRISFSEMKLTSIEAKSSSSGICSWVR